MFCRAHTKCKYISKNLLSDVFGKYLLSEIYLCVSHIPSFLLCMFLKNKQKKPNMILISYCKPDFVAGRLGGNPNSLPALLEFIF